MLGSSLPPSGGCGDQMSKLVGTEVKISLSSTGFKTRQTLLFTNSVTLGFCILRVKLKIPQRCFMRIK